MILLRKLLAVAILCLVVAAVFLAGCEKFDPGQRFDNMEPETTLSFSPADNDTANYRVRMNWYGWDVDGEITYYETIWDWPDSIVYETVGGDSIDWSQADWRVVIGTDSIFLVSASKDSINPDRAYETHEFAVRSVDNEGARDRTPEMVAFTAFTVVPDTDILLGPAGVTGPMVSFTWLGTDRDGVIVGYEFELFRREEGEWFSVASSGSLGADVVTATFGPLAGQHKFEVWSTDDAGATDQTPATSVFTCNPELAGPKLFVLSNVFGLFTYRGPVWSSQHNLPEPIFAGERLTFDWAATAEDYGGQVLGYRHAYDDTSTWPAWSIFDTHFEVAPELGRHSLYVSAIDNANVITRGRIYFDVVEASLDDYILIVDDYTWREAQSIWGTDAMRDQFYNDLLIGYERQRVEWDPSQHVVSGLPQPPNVDALRGASTVLWYVDHEQTTLELAFDPRQTTYNALAGYLRVGGNLILEGTEVTRQILGEPYPITIAETDTLPAEVFVRDFLHIERSESSGSSANKNAPWNYGYCFYGAVPTDPGMFTPMYIDSVGAGGYPEPGKWPIYTNPATNYNRGGLSQVEKIEVFQGTAIEAFTIDAYLNANYEGQPCSVLYLSGDNHGNVCYFSVPLYYLQFDHVDPVIDKVMNLFGEPLIQ